MHLGNRNRHAGEVHQVVVLQVLGNAVSAPSTTADCHRDRQSVILTPGGLIDVEAAHGDPQSGLLNALGVVGPDTAAVTGTAMNL